MTQRFPKNEKLCGQKRIEQVYHKGERFVCWPLRVTYQACGEAPTQVLIWAPKALFRHAVDRNRLRRRMREAYRLNKHLLDELAPGRYYNIAFNYIDREQQPTAVIQKAMRKALKKLAAR